MAKRKARKAAEQSAEARLADYWRQKAGLAKSDFDPLCGRAVGGLRDRGGPLEVNGSYRELPFSELTAEIALCIVRGFPLTREEYYVALATHSLLGDRPYEEFFTDCWHESQSHRSYIALDKCEECQKAAGEIAARRKGAKPGKK